MKNVTVTNGLLTFLILGIMFMASIGWSSIQNNAQQIVGMKAEAVVGKTQTASELSAIKERMVALETYNLEVLRRLTIIEAKQDIILQRVGP